MFCLSVSSAWLGLFLVPSGPFHKKKKDGLLTVKPTQVNYEHREDKAAEENRRRHPGRLEGERLEENSHNEEAALDAKPTSHEASRLVLNRVLNRTTATAMWAYFSQSVKGCTLHSHIPVHRHTSNHDLQRSDDKAKWNGKLWCCRFFLLLWTFKLKFQMLICAKRS